MHRRCASFSAWRWNIVPLRVPIWSSYAMKRSLCSHDERIMKNESSNVASSAFHSPPEALFRYASQYEAASQWSTRCTRIIVEIWKWEFSCTEDALHSPPDDEALFRFASNMNQLCDEAQANRRRRQTVKCGSTKGCPVGCGLSNSDFLIHQTLVNFYYVYPRDSYQKGPADFWKLHQKHKFGEETWLFASVGIEKSKIRCTLLREAISKVPKSLKRYCLCPAKGAFSAVTAEGSCLQLPLAWLCHYSFHLFLHDFWNYL